MADCSHVRCLQERRNIKRELLKWSKDMVHVVGLERIAEELMGRRKWKLFQENLSRSQTNTNPDHLNLEHKYIENLEPSIAENHITEKKEYITKNEAKDNFENDIQVKLENKITENPNSINQTIKKEINNFNSTSPLSTTLLELLEKPSIPIDWKPSDKCYFCVDGKLLTVNEKGELVAESGSALSEAELANRSTVDTDSGDSRNSTPDNSIVNVKKLIESHQHQQQHQQHQQQNQQQQQKHQQQRDSQNPPKMTSLESMAARLAAVASIHPRLPPGFGQLSQLSQLGQIYPNLYCQQLAQILPTTPTAETSLAAISPSNKNSPSPHDTPGGGEQPLDLSSKPTLNSPSIVSGDLKQASARPKHRINPVIANRRTYTEEELQNALQDIMSGKLGTRRAAVVYGIPRSTLRNKVYKMSSGQRRESSTPSSVHVFDADDDENDNDNDIDNDTDKTGLSDDEISNDKLLESSLLSDQEQPSRYNASLQKHRNSNNCGGGGTSLNDEQNLKSSSPLDSVTTASGTVASTTAGQNKTLTPQPSQTPPITPNWMDPNIILQTLLLSGSLTGGNASAAGAIASIANLLTSTQNASPDPATMGDIINVIKLQLDELAKKFANDSNNRENLNNERALLLDSMQLTQSLKQQQQLGQLHQHHHHQSRLPKSDTPETGSSIDMNETNEDGVILKIPSFKPVVVPASSSSTGSSIKSCDQNQISPLSTSAHHSIAPLLSRSPHQPNNLRGISPPLMRQSSESQSPPDVSIGEIIANSLNRFNQQNIKDSNLNKSHHHYNDLSEQYAKRASISVIKNIGGTDITKFAATPNLLNNYQNAANQCAAGKGTRPKRGKYRNYDRDSLTEAVKAVQRGEMSVHRAGSYYGVPHSTLEYKVKERHLMRPRKREPKPQPLDGGGNSGSTSSTSNSKHSNIPGLTAVNNIDKLKTSVGHQQQKSIMKPNPTSAFPNTSPNGMKVPIFDPALTAQLQYSPHLFWQHSAAAAAGFSALPMEFSPTGRTTSTGPGNGSSGNSTATSPGLQPNPFSPNTDSFLATQMMQRFHEESRLNAAASNNSKSPSLNSSNANINNNSSNNLNNNNNLTNVPGKTAREIAQSLYESGTQNGSFLDDIIRQTLDRKSNNDIPHGALFDQLIKNTKPPLSSSTLGGSTPSSSSSSSEIHSHALVNALTSNNKRSASPNSYPVINIKRERSSSPQPPPPPPTSSSLLSSIGNNLRDHDLRNHSKRISINDDNDSTTNTKLIRDSTSAAESLIKARLEGIMIKTEQQTNEHHITSDSISQRHHTNTSTSSSSDFNKNNTNNSTGPVNISHSIILEDLNGSNNGEGSTGSGIRTDNELINKDNRGAVAANNIISSDDHILKSKLGLIKSETDENL